MPVAGPYFTDPRHEGGPQFCGGPDTQKPPISEAACPPCKVSLAPPKILRPSGAGVKHGVYLHGKASRHAATTARGLLLFFEDAQAAIGVDHDFTPIFPHDGEKHSASTSARIVSDGDVFYLKNPNTAYPAAKGVGTLFLRALVYFVGGESALGLTGPGRGQPSQHRKREKPDS